MKTIQPTLKQPLARIISIFFGMLSLIMLLSCDRPPADKPDLITFTLILESQSHLQIDVGEKGHSHGDIRIFEGSLNDKNNKKAVGRFTVMQKIISLPQKSDNRDQDHEDRYRTIIFEFDDGSTIVIEGLTHYIVGKPRFAMNSPRVTAIVGGTGKYIGARGQMTSTRIGEFLFELKFEIIP